MPRRCARPEPPPPSEVLISLAVGGEVVSTAQILVPNVDRLTARRLSIAATIGFKCRNPSLGGELRMIIRATRSPDAPIAPK